MGSLILSGRGPFKTACERLLKLHRISTNHGPFWKFPPSFDTGGTFARARIIREVATERNLLNVHGNFYELPANNAGGFSRIRPVAAQNRMIQDFCSYRGLGYQ